MRSNGADTMPEKTGRELFPAQPKPKDGLKRAIDIAIALPVLLAASPFLLAAAIAVRLTSPGPAIFSQTRVGRDGVPFRCYKLRTMYLDAPSVPTHQAPSSAVTPLGKVFRRFKIDEFPQLWNVVRGEMSLVGPRPCLPSQAELIENRAERNVFSLRPGITGLAQVKGIDMSDPVLLAETDALYLRSRSIGMDFRILLRTFFR
jgi:O-antigen biosynthesis protein WbqP